MKLLFLYSCLLVILFQALFASTSPNGSDVTLKSKNPNLPKVKPAVGEPVKEKALAKSLQKKDSKHSKSNAVVKEDKPKSLSEILPKALVEIIIDYLNDTYSVIVSTHNWLLENEPGIAVDSARLYVIDKRESLRGLSHSIANLKKVEHHCIEFDNPQWSNYIDFSSSHDGRYVSFRHAYQETTFFGFRSRTKHGSRWLIQDSGLVDRSFKHVAFDSERLSHELLSRDGRMLFSYNIMSNVTCAYKIKETGKGPVAFMKHKLSGRIRALSGDGNCAMVANAAKLEIHDIRKDASRLVCRIDADVFFHNCALNEDGSEAAYVNDDKELRVIEVEKAVGGKVELAIVSVKVPKSMMSIDKLVYSDGNKLHVFHQGGKVSLFDPSTKALIPIEIPERGQMIIKAAISPGADYFATIEYVGEGMSEKSIYRTTVKCKLGKTEWMNFFGCNVKKDEAARL